MFQFVNRICTTWFFRLALKAVQSEFPLQRRLPRTGADAFYEQNMYSPIFLGWIRNALFYRLLFGTEDRQPPKEPYAAVRIIVGFPSG